jgi:8-oxo-dGTP pyrophosphatase MutT (NUDIX family)
MIAKPQAVCVVMLRDGSPLGITRRDDFSVIGLPGGKIEQGESAEEAAVRELMEETGYVVSYRDVTHLYTGIESGSGLLVSTYLAPDPGDDPDQTCHGVVSWTSWTALTAGPFGPYNLAVRHALADTVPEHWATTYGSGTLRRAIEEGLAWRELYLQERAAFEFGYGFTPAARSRLTVGRALAASDDPATTETCWWARVLRWRAERDGRPAKVCVQHARLDDGDGGAHEGVSIVYEPSTRPLWLPVDRTLIAFTTGPDGKTVNPC